MKTMFQAAMAAILLAVGLATSVSAALYNDGFIDPTWQGQPNSTYQEWINGFAAAGANNSPGYRANGAKEAYQTPTSPSELAALQAQYAPVNPNGTAKAGSAVGFMTSTYGIYSFSAKIQPTATVPDYNLGAGYNTTIRWQLSIDRIGEWLDLNTVTVTPLGGAPIGLATGVEYMNKLYDDATATWIYPTAYTTSTGTGSFQDLGLFAGVAAGYGEGPDYTKGYLFEWTLPGNVASYTLNATALGTSTSFKGTQVDTIARAAVPEPATLALAACGGVACLAARRRRK
ncbi:PEP-CTERM sorting domain-containing protein [Lacipirellula parvula]|uniref:Ice-binding protein C-terminal domain-containing protein n=1 Tax=Lacipirellula parvula TaxID=2650471 RepID=A0A5K7X4V6_9BACT|nr:PEP-CTERM sorting domain-containing protein [Lacipirellula parvula]BBO30807.1 hypothetical protein PLANPX_0419 [Lacipirellula parvula]